MGKIALDVALPEELETYLKERVTGAAHTGKGAHRAPAQAGMTFRVSQRAQARHDILELVVHIATENPKAAAALYDAYERILATTLATTPDLGRPHGPRQPLT